MSFSEEIIEDNISWSNQDLNLKTYSSLMNKENNIRIKTRSNTFIPLIPFSYYKICSLSTLIPVENIRFTFYITAGASPKITNIINIPDYSKIASNSTTLLSLSIEETDKTPTINSGMFINSWSNSYLTLLFRCIYPVFLLYAGIRFVFLLLWYYEIGGITLHVYEWWCLIVIISSFCAGVYGMVTYRSFKIENWTILNIGNIWLWWLTLFLLYCSWTGDGLWTKDIAEYEGKHKVRSIVYYVTFAGVLVTAIFGNFLLRREYDRWVYGKMYNKLNKKAITDNY